jgi:hypothetical protein
MLYPRQTGDRQIVSLCLPAMFQRNDMINLMAVNGHVLVDKAVLAPLSRSLKHEVSQHRRTCGKRHCREARA